MLESAPCGFSFPLKTITAAIRLVVFGLLSLRGSQYVFKLFSNYFKGGTPCHVVIQNWVMRFGLYKLNQAPEKRDDWVYILDHTIDFGAKKCLVILGITLECFKKNNCKIKHSDTEVMAIKLTEQADGASVTEAIKEVAKATGAPVQIISDGASNIKRGIKDFIAEKELYGKVRVTYDVTHKVGLILKFCVPKDPQWELFTKLATKSKKDILHTQLGYLVPPKPRDKSRWLNLEMYIDWAENILSLDENDIAKNNREKFKLKLGWVKEFENKIVEWRQILNIVNLLKHEIKSRGLTANTKNNFEKAILLLKPLTDTALKVKQQALEHIEQECRDIDDIYLGCSDIIESVIGKYKRFSEKSPMKEVGKAVLTMPVFTSDISHEEVKKAMESISAKELDQWLKDNVGKSLFSKRKKVFEHKKIKSSGIKFNEILQKVGNF